MEYKVLTVDAEYECMAGQKLEREVNQYIEKGWKPLGGVSISVVKITTLSDKHFFAQAMIKE